MKTTSIIKLNSHFILLLAGIVVIGGVSASSSFGNSGNWNVDAAGNWSGTANWNTAAVPGTAAGDVVGLSYNLTAARTITLDTPATVGTLNIGDPTSSFFGYTLSGSSTLTFNNSGLGASLMQATVGGAADAISAAVSLSNNLFIYNVNALTMSGTISGLGYGFTKAGNGTLTLNSAAADTYTGYTTLRSGSLVIDFANATSPAGGLIKSSSTLMLGGGTLQIKQQSGVTTAQTFSNTTLITNTSTAVIGTQVTSGALTINLGAITNNVGATIDFTVPTGGAIATSAGNVNGILGGWATTGNNVSSSSTGDWVANNGSGNIVTYSGYTTSGTPSSTTLASANYKGTFTTTASATINSFVETGDSQVGSGTTLTIGSGGIIFQGGGAWLKAGSTTTSFLKSGLSTGELFVHTPNAGANDWRIWDIIADGAVATRLIKDGPGYISLDNYNTYTGGTVVNGGTLLVGQPFNSFGTPTFNGGGTACMLGALTINPGATVSLAVADSLGYNPGVVTTPVNINGGTMDDAISSNQGYLSAFNLTGGTMSSSGGGSYNFNGSAGAINSLASPILSTISGPIQLRNNGLIITTAKGSVPSGIDLNISGAIGQYGGSYNLTKAGPGTLELSGANTFGGPTTINGGTLVVNGSLAAGSTVTVAANTMLAGGGTLAGPVTVQSGGTLAPGTVSAIGTLTINNSLTLNAGCTNFLRLNKTGGSITNDSVRGITGTLNYAGTLLVTNITSDTNALAVGDTFTLFNASGGFAGNFASLILPTLAPGLGWDASGLGSSGTLVVRSTLSPPVITTPPQSFTLMEGFPAQLTVAASGAPPLVFQWQKGGVNLPGATATNYALVNASTNNYALASASTNDSGIYTVVVTNSFGSVTSAPAALTVIPGTASNWIEVSNLVSGMVGVYNASGINSANYGADGPLLGNGDMQVVVVGDTNQQVFSIGKSDMWTDWSSDSGIGPIPVGGITIRPVVVGGSSATFRQEQHILDAQVICTSAQNFKTYSWVSANENTMVTELWTDGSTNISMAVDVWAMADTNFTTSAGVDTNGTLWATRQTYARPGARWTTRAALATEILGAAVTTTTDNARTNSASFTLVPGSTVRIYTVLGGGKNSTTYLTDARTRVGQLDDATIASLQTASVAWWRQFWLRSYVITHDQTLDTLYYGSLYLFACINRAEFTPAAQYPFCLTDTPGWQGDYHMDQEYMGQNCAFFSANRPELSGGVCQPLLDLMPVGQDIAANHMTDIAPSFTPCKGICYPVGLAPWGITAEYWFGSMVSDASWTGTLVAWNYYYYHDTNWLSSQGYPFLRGLGDFWETHLTNVNGRYVGYGSSIENDYGRNPVVDLSLVRFVMKALLTCSQDLNVDAAKRPVWQDIIDNLSDYPTNTLNGKPVFEWVEGETTPTPNHISLFPVYPAEDINRSSPQSLQDVAWNTLNASSETYAFALQAVVATRLGYPISAIIGHLKSDFINTPVGYWAGLRNNLSVGSGGHENGEYLEFIDSSMLESQEGFLRIFPNWYTNQPAKFARLRAEGAFVVSAEQTAAGQILPVTIISERGLPCVLQNPWPGSAISMNRNGVQAETISGLMVTLTNHPGDTLVLTPVYQNAPGSPNNVTALATTSNQVFVAWTGLPTAMSYLLYRDGVEVGSTSDISLTDSGLSPGGTYCYSVVATNNAGRSAASAPACLTMPSQSGSALWTGAGSNNLWSSSANWIGGRPTNGQSVFFLLSEGGLGLGNVNDLLTTAGQVVFAQGDWSISGAPVTLVGGILNLAGNNTWAINSTLGAAQPLVNNNGNLTLSGSLADAGYSLVVDGPGDTFLTGSITGSGGLTKAGVGTLTLSANNTYTGGTTVNGGTLNLSYNSGGSGTIGGTLTVNSNAAAVTAVDNALGYSGSSWVTNINLNFGTLSTAIVGDNGWGTTINMTGGTLSSSVSGGYFSIGQAGAGWGGVFNINAAGVPSVISANLTMRQDPPYAIQFNVARGTAMPDLDVTGSVLYQAAGGLTKSGPGILQLDGANTYTGPTVVSNGTLVVNGSLAAGSAVTVAAAGTLDGTGTINGPVSVNGTIAPGPGVGTLNTGAQTWNGGAVYLCEFNSTNAAGCDRLNISGALNVPAAPATPSTVKLVSLTSGNTPGPLTSFNKYVGCAWTIATTSGGVQNFATNTVVVDTTSFSNDFSGGRFALAVAGNNLVLVYTAAPVPPRFSSIAGVGGGVMQLSGTGEAGQAYVLLASSNLASANWTPIATNTAANGVFQFTDPKVTNYRSRFYRMTTP